MNKKKTGIFVFQLIKKDHYLKIFLLSLCIALCSCSTWDKLDKKERGAVIGGASGAIIGNAASSGGAGGTILGGAAGAVGGGLIGNEMDRRDRRDRYRNRY